MAQVHAALTAAASRLGELDPDHLADLERTLAVVVTDHHETLGARLINGGLVEAPIGEAKPDITIRASSDDLIALTEGELNVLQAWGTGRISIKAGFRDLMRLRSMTQRPQAEGP